MMMNVSQIMAVRQIDGVKPPAKNAVMIVIPHFPLLLRLKTRPGLAALAIGDKDRAKVR